MEFNLVLLVEAGAKITWFMVVANATDWIDHKLQQSSTIDIEHSFYQPRFLSPGFILMPAIPTSPARRLIPRASAVGAAGVGAEIMIILNPQMTPAGLFSLAIIAYAR